MDSNLKGMANPKTVANARSIKQRIKSYIC